MGLSISVSAAIIFVASVIVFGALLGAFDSAQHTALDAERDAQDRHVDVTNTKLTISELDEVNGTLAIVNNGEVTLRTDEIILIINGTLANDRISSRTIEGIGTTNLWMPNEKLILSITGDITDAQMKIVCGNGVSAYL